MTIGTQIFKQSKILNRLQEIHNQQNIKCYVGITKESNRRNRASILLHLIKTSGVAALGREPRDPMFIPFRKKYKQELAKVLKQNIWKTKIKDLWAVIGNQQKENIINEIKTKGHGKWYENTEMTKEMKRKSKNPVVVGHADDIYQATETLIKCFTYKIGK